MDTCLDRGRHGHRVVTVLEAGKTGCLDRVEVIPCTVIDPGQVLEGPLTIRRYRLNPILGY